MEIKKVEPKPCEKSIIPGISFDVEISYTKLEEAILSVTGWLETNDGKIVSEVKEEVLEETKHCEIGARNSIFDKEFREDIYKTKLIAFLDEKALDHIEKKRLENKKRDVLLTLNLKAKIIRRKAVISHIYEEDPRNLGLTPVEIDTNRGKTTNWRVLVYAHDPQFRTDRINRWILSGDGGPVFLIISEQVLRREITIPSSDWIHDYAPKLGIGEYFIVEIPKGAKVIEEAWRYIEEAEECFRRWDSKGVFDKCREAGKVLDKAMKESFGESFTYNERWGRAYLRFNCVASLGLHLEDLTGQDWEELIKGLPKGFPRPKKKADYPSDEVKIGKTDAEHLLIVTKALIKYAEELMKEREV